MMEHDMEMIFSNCIGIAASAAVIFWIAFQNGKPK